MPFKSKQQAKWMFVNDPDMAKEWASKTKDWKKLPKRVKSKKRKKALDLLVLTVKYANDDWAIRTVKSLIERAKAGDEDAFLSQWKSIQPEIFLTKS